MRRILSFALIVLISFQITFAQEKTYDVLHEGTIIGMVKVSMQNSGDAIEYNYHSDFTLDLMLEIQLEEIIKAVVFNDTLKKCEIKSNINGKNRFVIEQNWNDEINGYNRLVNGLDKSLEKEPAQFSFVQLFFHEPKGRQKVYSEIFDKDFSVEKGKNYFIVTDLRGRKQKFYYDENGNFNKAILINSLAEYEIRSRS